MKTTRERLDELKSRRVAASSAPRRSTSTPADPLTLAGRACPFGSGAYWRIETAFDRICPEHTAAPPTLARALTALTDTEAVDPCRTTILDIETGGFAGTPVFLIGVVYPDLAPLRVVQYLARDYPEEEAILRALHVDLADRDTWITFNGKSFDEPFLRDRAALYRIPLRPSKCHIDLLHAARRRWRNALPNCRLVTLENEILRRPRIGDVPSADVPDLFHHFIRTGNARPLHPVLLHNQIDLITCAELVVRLAAPNSD